jgi:hypothetical protein
VNDGSGLPEMVHAEGTWGLPVLWLVAQGVVLTWSPLGTMGVCFLHLCQLQQQEGLLIVTLVLTKMVAAQTHVARDLCAQQPENLPPLSHHHHITQTACTHMRSLIRNYLHK